MHPIALFLSPSGRLGPKPFVLAVVVVYIAGAASQFLTMPDIIARGGLWPFLGAQAFLVWVWFALHAKRLRDAGWPVAGAIGVVILYALAMALFVIVAAAFLNPPEHPVDDPNTTSALTLLLLIYIFAILFGHPDFGIVWFIVTGLMVMALMPLVVAFGFSLWVATRPSVTAGVA